MATPLEQLRQFCLAEERAETVNMTDIEVARHEAYVSGLFRALHIASQDPDPDGVKLAKILQDFFSGVRSYEIEKDIYELFGIDWGPTANDYLGRLESEPALVGTQDDEWAPGAAEYMQPIPDLDYLDCIRVHGVKWRLEVVRDSVVSFYRVDE